MLACYLPAACARPRARKAREDCPAVPAGNYLPRWLGQPPGVDAKDSPVTRMKFPKSSRSSSAVLGVILSLATTAFGGPPTPRGPSAAAAPTAAVNATEASIVQLTTTLLEDSQFAHHPFDKGLAGTLLDRYLDALDASRSLFLQADVNEFAAYRATLAETTHEAGDTKAAHAIFGRYLQRLQERTSYATEALRTATFDFSGHDVYSFDREHAPRPRDLGAAKALWLQQLRSEYLDEKLTDKRPDEIARSLTRRYTQQLATMKALTGDEVLDVYLNALAHVYDPHSDYFDREEMQSFSIAMNLSLAGIGATLQSADGYCKIVEMVPGGPAARGGVLKNGDRIVAVAQAGQDPVDITNLPLSRSVEMIRGPKGSTVTLTILPASAAESSLPKKVTLVRDEIKLEDQAAKARIIDLPTGRAAPLRVGVLELPSFYADVGGGKQTRSRSATADVARLLAKLNAEHVRGIVLDLRRNGGGSLKEAISLTGLFIRRGPVVQTRDQAGKIDVEVDDDPGVLYDGPLVVLTSRLSASASEILTGALQDYGRAVVVGDSSTFGKGTVQTIYPLADLMDRLSLAHAYDPGALKVTISKFYRPSGASTQLRGVASDIVLPSTSDVDEVSESALKDPLPWDTVPPANYDHLNRVQPFVEALKSASSRRIASGRDFRELGEDVARLHKNLATKSVSLNEAERRQEIAQAKARHAEREREDRAARAARPTTYEITLENAGAPGLPAPLADHTTPDKTSPAGASPPVDPLDDDRSAPGKSGNDILLNESTQILADYVNLLPSNGATVAQTGATGGRN